MRCVGLALPFVLYACGNAGLGPSSATAPRVISIAPATGSTLGGTAVTITGALFSAGAAVTIGSVPAIEVTVVSPTIVTAVTPQHAAGAADVVVAVSGQSGSLPGGYRYVAPHAVANDPPIIVSIGARGTAPREPAQYATLDEAINVTAVVTDAETPTSQLTFKWSADAGAFTGDGASATWTAPHAHDTPSTIALRLTVTERYQTTDNQGLPVTRENQVQGTTAIRLHNSIHEVGDLAVQFLVDFSRQLDAAFVVRNFTNSCPEAADELRDVQNDNRDFIIRSYNIGTPSTSVPFTGQCPFRNRRGDACAQVRVEWNSVSRATGQAGVAIGTDQVTAIFENDQWRLCASDFNPSTATSTLRLRRWTGLLPRLGLHDPPGVMH